MCIRRQFRCANTRSGGRRAYSAGGLEAGSEGAVLLNRGYDLLKQGVEVVLAAVHVLLHARHELLQVFFADNLHMPVSAAHSQRAPPCLNQPCWAERSTLFRSWHQSAFGRSFAASAVPFQRQRTGNRPCAADTCFMVRPCGGDGQPATHANTTALSCPTAWRTACLQRSSRSSSMESLLSMTLSMASSVTSAQPNRSFRYLHYVKRATRAKRARVAAAGNACKAC